MEAKFEGMDRFTQESLDDLIVQIRKVPAKLNRHLYVRGILARKPSLCKCSPTGSRDLPALRVVNREPLRA